MHPRGSSRIAVSGTSTLASIGAVGALVGAQVALAFGPWFVRLADTGPVAAGLWRIVLAIPLLAVMAAGTGWRPRGLPRGLLVMTVLSGICFAGDLGTWHIGILHTTMANATLFGNCATLIFPVYGFLVARAWPTRMQGLALLMAAIGATLLMGRSYQLDPRHLVGDLLCVFAGILYSVYFVFMAKVRDTMPPLPALLLASLSSIVPLLLFALAMGERIVPHHWLPLAGLALVSQVIGQGLMIYALGRFSPLVIGISLLIQPIVAGTVGWLVYGEKLGAPDLIGAALVAIALVLVRDTPKPVAEPLAPAGAEAQ
jgi:drug/metabolite transporter (DMT)-like permease